MENAAEDSPNIFELRLGYRKVITISLTDSEALGGAKKLYFSHFSFTDRSIRIVKLIILGVVPCSPQLLRMFHRHFNAEVCISKVGSIKYLFKYECKGQDKVSVEVRKPRNCQTAEVQNADVNKEVLIDEIKDYRMPGIGQQMKKTGYFEATVYRSMMQTLYASKFT